MTNDTERRETPERVLACLHACEGMHTADLESEAGFCTNTITGLAAERDLLKAQRDSLMATTKIAYTILADIRHQWAGRHTPEGQGALCAMRDVIASAENRDPQEVQDEYTNAALASVKGVA